MTDDIKKEVLDIAEYLGCNGPELWSEMSKLIERIKQEAYKEGYVAGGLDVINRD